MPCVLESLWKNDILQIKLWPFYFAPIWSPCLGWEVTTIMKPTLIVPIACIFLLCIHRNYIVLFYIQSHCVYHSPAWFLNSTFQIGFLTWGNWTCIDKPHVFKLGCRIFKCYMTSWKDRCTCFFEKWVYSFHNLFNSISDLRCFSSKFWDPINVQSFFCNCDVGLIFCILFYMFF